MEEEELRKKKEEEEKRIKKEKAALNEANSCAKCKQLVTVSFSSRSLSSSVSIELVFSMHLLRLNLIYLLLQLWRIEFANKVYHKRCFTCKKVHHSLSPTLTIIFVLFF